MIRSLTTLIVLVSLLAACKKDVTQSESALYGTWVKGNQPGDTLQFLEKNRKHILRQNDSFNPAMPAYTEKEYKYQNGKLSIQLFAPFSEEFNPIDSFRWISFGREFTLQGIQLYIFMSSTQTYFTYRKL
jgi:hypothetical protein